MKAFAPNKAVNADGLFVRLAHDNCAGYGWRYAVKPAETQEVRLKVRDLVKALEADGWYLVRTRGSHRQYRHAKKAGTVTVAGKPSLDIPPGTLNSILKQAGLKT